MNTIEAYNRFQEQFLKGKRSIFSEEESTLNEDSIEYLLDNFVNNGDVSNQNFNEKIKKQLIDHPKKANEEIRMQAIEVLAHAIWLWRLPPSNATPKGRLNSVNEIIALIQEDKKITKESNKKVYKDWFTNVEKGFAATGTYYNTNKPFELAFIICFFQKWLNNDNGETAKQLVLDESENSDQQTITESNGKLKTKSVAIKNALMFLTEPSEHQPILSSGHKKEIVESFNSSFGVHFEHKKSCIMLI